MRFHNDAPYNSGGGTATLERATDFLDAMDSIAGQLVSSFGSNKTERTPLPVRAPASELDCELRFGDRAAVSIGVASSPSSRSVGLGGGTGQGNAGFDFKQNITQFIDNFTYIRAAHSYKFGFDWQHIYDERTNAPQFLYTFPIGRRIPGGEVRSDAARLHDDDADHGRPRRSTWPRTSFSVFVQDDWQVAPKVKILYGVRYDLYRYPDGLANAPLVSSQAFNIDKNNFGPRVGVAWSMDEKTVLRASTGHHVRPADSRRIRAGAAS